MTGTLVSACDSGGSNGSPDALIPLEQGNQWTAELSGPYRNEEVDVEVTSESDAVITDRDQERTYRDTILVRKNDQGILIRGRKEFPQDFPAMLLKYPVEEGESYQHTDGEGNTFQISVSRESVTVPAGEFDCLLYTITEVGDPDEITRAWIKPGMGPVRFKEAETVWELTSTNVNS
jgi:hypothetical protein